MKRFLCYLVVLAVIIKPISLQTTHKVIIIGAGASGIGASVSLSAKNVDHLILEGRSRLGGRVYATTIAGVPVDHGASFVHSPQTNNAINSYATLLNWGKTLANFKDAYVAYTSGAALADADYTSAASVLAGFKTYMCNLVSPGNDKSIQFYWDQHKPTLTASEKVINKVYFQLTLEATLNGAQLGVLSANNYCSSTGKNSNDYLPATSYAALLNAVYTAYCKKAVIAYNKFVTAIDYSGALVKLTTSTGQIYYANKVINSVPLGILKAGNITFTPALPTAYQNAINSIGFGTFNKIIVTLNNTFWTTGSRVLTTVNAINQPIIYTQSYIVPTNVANVLMFFVSGSTSKALNSKTDSDIIANLTSTLNTYSSGVPLSITNSIITRWEQDAYALGSYSFYQVNTTTAHFTQISTAIQNKLWFVGEHTHPSQSSNVHGAFQSGLWAGAAAAGQTMFFLYAVALQLALLIFCQ